MTGSSSVGGKIYFFRPLARLARPARSRKPARGRLFSS
jgi:hypothetical protein